MADKEYPAILQLDLVAEMMRTMLLVREFREDEDKQSLEIGQCMRGAPASAIEGSSQILADLEIFDINDTLQVLPENFDRHLAEGWPFDIPSEYLEHSFFKHFITIVAEYFDTLPTHQNPFAITTRYQPVFTKFEKYGFVETVDRGSLHDAEVKRHFPVQIYYRWTDLIGPYMYASGVQTEDFYHERFRP